jgi:endonuclease/exonuclease/phosphatase (EEP) superfamily protein YafD
MKTVLVALAISTSTLALAGETIHFVSLDTEKHVWVVDVSGRSACETAAKMLAKDQRKQFVEAMPTVDGDIMYLEGCIAVIK